MNHYQNNSMGNGGGVGGGGLSRLCYQVDFNAVATGKVIAMSKRRIRWRFGFPNQEAINSGKAGTECRGEEHDVTLVWSISSGKRMLMSNGQQIYVGVTKSKIFEHMWQDKNGTALKVVANSIAPTYNVSGVRQYDLFIDGKSFFSLPKVFEIGLRGSTVHTDRIPGVITDGDRESLDRDRPTRHSMAYSESGRSLVVPSSAKEEEEDLKRAIKASLEESRQYLSMKGKLDDESIAASTLTNTIVETVKPAQTTEDVPLIDFLSDAPTPAASNQALIPVESPQTNYHADPFGGPFPTNNVAAAPAPPACLDEFVPQAPTYQDISDQILLNYAPSLPASGQTTDTSVVTSSNPFDDPPAGSVASSNLAPNNAYTAPAQSQNNNANYYQPRQM